MRIGPYTRLGPDLDTTWGTYTSPYITQPASAVVRPWMPPTIRGRHQYRTQPRPLTAPIETRPSDGVATDIAMRGRSSLVTPASAYGALPLPIPDPQAETKVGLYLFLGTVALLSVGWLAFGAQPQGKGPR